FFLRSKEIALCSLGESECIFMLPHGHCQKGHSLTLLFMPMNSKSVNFFPEKGDKGAVMVIGRVEEIENCEEGRCSVRFHFSQWVAEEWQEVLKHYYRRQNVVMRLINRLKD